uniref:Uncharacterized protein n=1 Tax=Pyrodinium bahamense TaxID=73915 RepID=A0A7S0F7V3_9DINO
MSPGPAILEARGRGAGHQRPAEARAMSSGEHPVLPLSLSIGSGHIPARTAIAIACRASRRLRAALDDEALWKQLFLSCYLDRQTLVPSSWLQRLAARHAVSSSSCEPMTPSGTVDWEASVVFVGPPRSGKTCLVHRLCTGAFPEHLDRAPFLGTGGRAAGVTLAGAGAGRVRLWEPSGSSRERVLNQYIRASNAVIVVVDLADTQAPCDAESYLARAVAHARAGTVFAVCGTQADACRARRQPLGAALRPIAVVARAADAECFTCSARTGEAVADMFCAVLAACRELGGTVPRTLPLLSSEAGTLSSNELLRAFRRR